MCGIIGIASNKSVTSNIINSLKRLEYRGYDSAGIATISKENLNEKKCSGRVDELEKILLCDVQEEISPEIEKSFLNLLHKNYYLDIEQHQDFEKYFYPLIYMDHTNQCKYPLLYFLGLFFVVLELFQC